MEIIKPIKIPIVADFVLSPEVVYGERTGIYFITREDRYGRITFENLDAIKICRGEILPYAFDYSLAEQGTWVFQVENSTWQKERFDYEKKHYEGAYEFGGNVRDMLTDFKHYLFSFHDQFVEVIARGFWFEEAEQSLLGKGLTDGHPFLPLPAENAEIMTVQSLNMQIRRNPEMVENLIRNAQFCSQKIFEFALMLDEKASVNHTVTLSYKEGQLVSTLKGYFGGQEAEFAGIADLEQVQPFLEKYMKEVSERRHQMGK
ncbi:hypothetical protein [Listeria costaricensis]|uniref:hypothetical protein n=1 Tax=Listeria costaricensis TaxID=2026604 RepID=UPI000C07AF30|nr:hypothetical protein [Listeria costaricensis]